MGPEEAGEGRTGNLKGREEKAGREEQGFRPTLGLSSSSPFSLQEVPDERNGSGVPGTDTATSQRKRGRGQAAKALNPSPGKMDSTRCDEEPRKGLEAGMDTSLASARGKDLRAALKKEAGSGLLSSGQCLGKGAGARGLPQWLGQTLECTFLVGGRGWLQAGVRREGSMGVEGEGDLLEMEPELGWEISHPPLTDGVLRRGRHEALYLS